jgi:Protein of unknown function (DUF2947)
MEVEDIYSMINQISTAIAEAKPDFCDLHSVRLGSILRRRGRDVVTLDSEIRPLSEESSRRIWLKLMGRAKHIMTIPNNHWISALHWTAVAEWLQAYTENDPHIVSQSISKYLDVGADAEVLFCSGPCDLIVASWSAFLDNWISFAELNDDGPHIFFTNYPYALMFTPSGSLLKADLS